MRFLALLSYLFVLSGVAGEVYPTHEVGSQNQITARVCRKTKVAVLGAGVAGITAAQVLHDADIDDFVIIEYNEEIGGRCKNSKFGKDRDGNAYSIEIGANWVQGTILCNGQENPILTLAKKYGIVKFPSNASSLATYDPTGPLDFLHKVKEFDNAYHNVQKKLAYTATRSENIPDTDLRSALMIAGNHSEEDAQAQAVEWYRQDYEYAQSPDHSSRDFTMANHNSTFGGPGDDNNFVFDQRGFNTFIHGQAAEFLEPNDRRLLLNSPVVKIDWSNERVTAYISDGSCIESEYAINTFSLGVLRSGDVTFTPPLPVQKHAAMSTFQFGTFTKIFIQFPPDQVFWNKSTEFFLYASPSTRGYFPVWQSLDHADFLPGSGILMVTVVAKQAYIIESQDDETTKQQVLEVLREMFGDVPEPVDFMYPRWSTMPWSYGSFSNWPPGFTLEDHKKLRETAGRMLFAGEATSTEYYGYLHGAYFEGHAAGREVVGYLGNEKQFAL